MKNIFRMMPLLAALVLPSAANASIRLPEIIGDNMVLQRNSEARIWGWADAGATVKAAPSWTSEVFEGKADRSGRWEILLHTPDASYEPRTISISEGKKDNVIINNVLIGEVWFCSGQSNMEMPLNGFWNCPVEGANKTISEARLYPGIRVVTIPKTGASEPQKEVGGTWKDATPENVQWASATAYHFAKMVNTVLDVPVGIIVCAWGGTSVEGWLPREVVEAYPDIDLEKTFRPLEDGSWSYTTPVTMYNGMLHPLIGYTVKGFLWYQGESNVGRHDTYAERLSTMVSLWREKWGLGELPFYFVEIAPYEYGGDGLGGALLREAQYQASLSIPNSGMIGTNDLVKPYEFCQIHPCMKTEVGERLAAMALNRTYGVTALKCDSPSFREMKVEGSKAIIYFNNDLEGFSPWRDIQGFEIAGEDRVFHPAEANLDDYHKVVIVSSPAVPVPVAVRYSFKDFPPGNLKGARDLPVIPFRTDSW